MKVDNGVLEVLASARAEGDRLILKSQMDPKMYKAVDKVIKAVGGEWNRHKRAHLFGGDASEAIEQVLLTGEVTTYQDLNYFPTPRFVAEQMVSMARAYEGDTVLEPSAGKGALAQIIAESGGEVTAIEKHEPFIEELWDTGACYKPLNADFLEVGVTDVGLFGAVIMNPPFAKQADILHVTHALDFVAPGGSLVSVMSNGVMFRDTLLTREFRKRVLDLGGYFEPLPDDAFKESGAGVRTVLCVIESVI